MFYNCTGLESITIPNTIESIGDRAFCNCKGLKSIMIPDSVRNMGEKVFNYCESLTVYTNNDYVINYCKEYEIPVKPLKSKDES